VTKLEKQYAYNTGYIFLKLSSCCNGIQQERKKGQLKRKESTRNVEIQWEGIKVFFSYFTVGSEIETVIDQEDRSNNGDREKSEDQSPLPPTRWLHRW